MHRNGFFPILGAFAAIVALMAGATPAPASAQDIIIDNADAGFATLNGSWSTGTSAGDKFSSDYRFASTVTGAATAESEWRPTLSAAGIYEVAVWYPQGANRAVDAPFTIYHAHGHGTATVDQTVNGGGWHILGVFEFFAGNSSRVTLKNNAEPSKVVLADAVRFRPVTLGTAEFRGIWVSRFEWPSSNPTTMKANLRRVMSNAVRGGFNSVVLQVRGQGDVLYPSPNEVWSTLVGGADPGFDPLRFALDEAHARGLKLHAYFNTHVAWGSGTPPANPNHLYYQHANPADPNARDWLIADDTGTVQGSTVDGYFWLAPGNPAMQAYLRAQIMHLVRTYPDLDGIHFDRIRMPSALYSHDAVSTARRAGDGNPAALNFADWTCDQFTRFLRDVYAEVRAEHPTLQLSSAPLGLYQQSSYPGYSSGYLYGKTKCYQDAQAWMQAGAMDWIAPQIYWADGGSPPHFSEVLPDWLANAFGRHVYPGTNAVADVTRTRNEIVASRNLGALGQQYWSYSVANANDHFTSLKAAEYGTYADPPAMSWITAPTTAIIVGTVTDFSTGDPITDAHITRTGSAYTALSSADGLYSFLLVQPGNVTLSATKTGVGSASVVVGNLAAGDVRRVNLALAVAGTPTQVKITSAPTSATAGQNFTVTVEIHDSMGTRIDAGSTTVEFSATGGAGTLAGTLSATTTAGTATVTLAYSATGTIALHAVDAAGHLTSDAITIVVGTAGANNNKKNCGTLTGPNGNADTAENGIPLLLALLATLLFACRRPTPTPHTAPHAA